MLGFEYELRRHGWADCKFTWKGGEISYPSSYLTDPIGAMAQQARWLADPTYRSNTRFPDPAIFSGEPGELVLEIALAEDLPEETWRDQKLDVLAKPIFVTLHEVDTIGVVGYKGKSDVVHAQLAWTARKYAEMVFGQLLALYERFGLSGYRERWMEADFPLAHFAATGKQLQKPLPRRPLW